MCSGRPAKHARYLDPKRVKPCSRTEEASLSAAPRQDRPPRERAGLPRRRLRRRCRPASARRESARRPTRSRKLPAKPPPLGHGPPPDRRSPSRTARHGHRPVQAARSRSARAAWASSSWPSRQQPVRRKVALKIIKPGMDSRQVIARFEAERQALALMDHPNIAQVLDAGSHWRPVAAGPTSSWSWSRACRSPSTATSTS